MFFWVFVNAKTQQKLHQRDILNIILCVLLSCKTNLLGNEYNIDNSIRDIIDIIIIKDNLQKLNIKYIQPIYTNKQTNKQKTLVSVYRNKF